MPRFVPILMVLVLPGQSVNAVKSLDRLHPASVVESAEVLQAVCPSETVDQAGQAAGCRSCPSFTSFFDPEGASEKASGEAAVDRSVAFILEDVIFGHFTAPRSNEVVASFSGCEPHNYNFGGTVLLQQTSAGWVRTQYAPAVISKNCRAYTLASGREILFCEQEFGALNTLLSWVYDYDFSKPYPAQRDAVVGEPSAALLSLADTTSWCQAGQRPVGAIERTELVHLPAETSPSVRVVIKAGLVTIPKGQEFRCDRGQLLSSAQAYNVDLVLRGEQFRIAARSRPEVEQLDRIYSHGPGL
jgi:hypothetical protein